MTFFVYSNITPKDAHSYGSAVIAFIMIAITVEGGFMIYEGYLVIKGLLSKPKGKSSSADLKKPYRGTINSSNRKVIAPTRTVKRRTLLIQSSIRNKASENSNRRELP